MRELVLNTEEAPNKWYAARDAAIRSYAASTHYSPAKKLEAERVKLALELLYSFRAIHVNFRNRFITIKMEHPNVRERKQLREMEREWEFRGIVKAVSPQGIMYRIPKA